MQGRFKTQHASPSLNGITPGQKLLSAALSLVSRLSARAVGLPSNALQYMCCIPLHTSWLLPTLATRLSDFNSRTPLFCEHHNTKHDSNLTAEAKERRCRQQIRGGDLRRDWDIRRKCNILAWIRFPIERCTASIAACRSLVLFSKIMQPQMLARRPWLRQRRRCWYVSSS